MRKGWILLLLLPLLLTGGGCTPASPEEASAQKQEVIVFAAASLTETLTQLGEEYTRLFPHVTLRFNFDSSGTLLTQIREGAACDLFLSAGQPQMEVLEEEGFLEEPPLALLENQVVLAVGEGNSAAPRSFSDLPQALSRGDLLLAIGNEDVPVGQYSRRILAYYGLAEETLIAQGCLTYGSNVKEITTQISEGLVDCGIIYRTDAYSAGLTVADRATPAQCGQVLYPAAILKNASQKEAAQSFLEFLQGAEAAGVFSSYGFIPIAP